AGGGGRRGRAPQPEAPGRGRRRDASAVDGTDPVPDPGAEPGRRGESIRCGEHGGATCGDRSGRSKDDGPGVEVVRRGEDPARGGPARRSKLPRAITPPPALFPGPVVAGPGRAPLRPVRARTALTPGPWTRTGPGATVP